MFRPVLIILFLVNYFIRYTVCINERNDLNSTHNTPSSKIKIPKCCAQDEAVVQIFTDDSVTLRCEKHTESVVPISNLDIVTYNKKFPGEQVLNPPSDMIEVVLENRPDETSFQFEYFRANVISDLYLREDGLLYFEYRNAYNRWISINTSLYCVDYELILLKNASVPSLSESFEFWCRDFAEAPKPTSPYYTAALFISVVFLFLVLVVYMLLPNLRNLGGMVLMAYVFSILFAFLCLGIMQISDIEADGCIALTTIIYFFFLASFCWMNVMSCDIWWTFRGYAKARPIHRRGENFKFVMYCLYGWGVPLAMSIFFVVVNDTDMDDKPWFVKPMIPTMGCFIEGGQKLVYLYAPMLILILWNWMFFLMTAFNIWRLSRGTAVLDSPAAGTPQAHRSQRNRFFIYLKLSIIMGVNWILEVMSSLTTEYNFWYITDGYNLLIGLAIFLIFVCKKKIYRELKARYIKKQTPQRSLTKSQTSSTTLSTTSQDTQLQVFHHPNGNSGKR